MKEIYTYKTLIQAYCAHLEFKGKASELATYYTGYYRVLSELFGVDFDVKQIDREQNYRLAIFRSAADQAVHLKTPFSGFLEAPEAIVELYQIYGHKLQAVNREMSTALHTLMEDICERVYGPMVVTFTSSDLRKKGFDDTNPPDPLDFW